jgi:hypothetical protein
MFRVDYNDRAYPKVVTVTEDGISFREAKNELINHLKHQYEHWRDALRAARRLKRKDALADTK